jgi:acetoin utilization deacetylase AcuC-like enzyme
MPSVFPYGPNPRPRSAKTRKGLYCFDTYTPITAGTFEAALGGAAAALHAADHLAAGTERILYVLTRPPGHHAERSQCGGYSYLNNAALAADRLAKHGPVAVLDLDVHHGNGTQHLFWNRADVLTVSLHGDPIHLYPYFSGFADETGTGTGLGFNLNLPLPAGSSMPEYEPAIAVALDCIAKFRPAFLVVPFGADAHERDPIGGMKLPTEAFAELGRLVNQLGLPTIVVQEGGYNLDVLGDCVCEFLTGFTLSQSPRSHSGTS